MSTIELVESLREKNIPNTIFAINKGYKEDRYCIVLSGGIWEVYYGERGEKVKKRTFIDEDKACRYYLKWVIKEMKYI